MRNVVLSLPYYRPLGDPPNKYLLHRNCVGQHCPGGNGKVVAHSPWIDRSVRRRGPEWPWACSMTSGSGGWVVGSRPRVLSRAAASSIGEQTVLRRRFKMAAAQ